VNEDLILDNPIGILGGTFDPIHNCHLYLANLILKGLNLQQIRFIPCYQPVHRSSPKASPIDRAHMVQMAIKKFPHFLLDLREINREGPSYMVDTLTSLRQDLPQTPFGLILGMDSYLEITTWKNWQELLQLCHFIVVNRPDYSLDTHPHSSLQQRVVCRVQDLHTILAGKIFLFQAESCDICATTIRQKIQRHENISNLVPKEVALYIKQQHLYTS
jgi:nicotinate-nucleotide adenylyltransferase